MKTSAALQIGWVSPGPQQMAASAFLAELMPQDAAYISHSEIQWGLSPDGQGWAAAARAMLIAYFQDLLAQGGEIAHALDDAGKVQAAAAVQWSTETPTPFVSVQDIIVAPALRGQGLGECMMHFIEAEARQRGMAWLFLESGVRNQRAHAFFERGGFAPVSHTFSKRLV